MNWQTLVIEVVAAILSAVSAWVFAKVKTLISTKISNEKARKLADTTTSIVSSVVRATYQSYVEGIKGTDAWTKGAQKEALQRALDAAKAQMCDEVKSYIEQNYGDINEWLTSQIEATIYSLKATNGGGGNENN